MLNTFKLLKKLVLHTHQPVDRAQIVTEGPPHGRPQAALGMIGLRCHDVDREVTLWCESGEARHQMYYGDMSIFLRSCLFSATHPELTKEVIQTWSDLTGSSSSFLCQVQKAWVAFTIFSSPWPKLASRKTDHSGDGCLYLSIYEK